MGGFVNTEMEKWRDAYFKDKGTRYCIWARVAIRKSCIFKTNIIIKLSNCKKHEREMLYE